MGANFSLFPRYKLARMHVNGGNTSISLTTGYQPQEPFTKRPTIYVYTYVYSTP